MGRKGTLPPPDVAISRIHITSPTCIPATQGRTLAGRVGRVTVRATARKAWPEGLDTYLLVGCLGDGESLTGFGCRAERCFRGK